MVGDLSDGADLFRLLCDIGGISGDECMTNEMSEIAVYNVWSLVRDYGREFQKNVGKWRAGKKLNAANINGISALTVGALFLALYKEFKTHKA